MASRPDGRIADAALSHNAGRAEQGDSDRGTTAARTESRVWSLPGRRRNQARMPGTAGADVSLFVSYTSASRSYAYALLQETCGAIPRKWMIHMQAVETIDLFRQDADLSALFGK